MKFVIVSGLSGAGKTVALHTLEDMGAYCIDNLPVALIPSVAGETAKLSHSYPLVALGVDARSISARDIPALLQTLDDSAVAYQVLFLEARDAVLIKRFSETRRRHPLSFGDVPLAEAIRRERQLLAPLAARAEIFLDTSETHLHQLRDLIRLKLEMGDSSHMTLLFQSFGFKYGIPQDADFVFDARCLPNPYWQPHLRALSGRDDEVCAFLQDQPKVRQMFEDIKHFIHTWVPQFEADNRSYVTVAIGCTGGHHRSVYLVEQLAAHFQQERAGVLARHRDLQGGQSRG
jgi:RNase adapter protein RapZ